MHLLSLAAPQQPKKVRMSLTDKTKDCCGLNLYNVAKITTLIEICCTGNVTHLIELYGLHTKKTWAISLGYFWRMFIGENS